MLVDKSLAEEIRNISDEKLEELEQQMRSSPYAGLFKRQLKQLGERDQRAIRALMWEEYEPVLLKYLEATGYLDGHLRGKRPGESKDELLTRLKDSLEAFSCRV